MSKQLTNVQVVKRLMESSPLGAKQIVWNQCFIMEAIRRYAEQCISEEGQAALRESMRAGFVNPEVWITTAQEIRRRLTEFGRS